MLLVFQQYAESFILAPLHVVYTLSNVEYQKTARKKDLGLLIKETHSKHGILFLFRGHLSNFCYKFTSLIQPILEELLNDLFDVYEDRNIYTALASTALTAWLLAPLETARTRSIVQAHFTWSFSKQMLFPTVLLHSLKVAFGIYSQHYISTELGFEEDLYPIMNGLCKLVSIGLETLFVAPLELVRDRLALQDNSIPDEIEPDPSQSHVQISPKPYTGIISCMSRVIMEEGTLKTVIIDNFSQTELASVYGKKNGSRFQGLLSLYRGFWVRYAISVAEHISKEINGNELNFEASQLW
jgi:hypothetical protein